LKIKRQCENPFCRKAFEADHWEVARKKAILCSRKCQHEWLGVVMTGKSKKRVPKLQKENKLSGSTDKIAVE